MSDVVTLEDAPREARVALLEELGYGVEGDIVVDSDGEPVLDRYTEDPVELSNLVLLPGSEILLNDNPYSLACYMEDYGEF